MSFLRGLQKRWNGARRRCKIYKYVKLREKVMNVVYYSSDFFSQICGVAIQSLCESNINEEEIIVYVIEDNISELNKKRMKTITDKYNRKLIFIKMPTQEEVYPEAKIDLGRTYARMALGEILPKSVDRVLSLDSDTLVVDSLHDMYNTQFHDGEYVAGVYDCVGKAMQNKVLHGPKDMCYCNAGMFLIDLDKWRAENVGKKLLNAVMENADGKHIMYFLEQDLMNLVFYGHLKVLNPRYNMITSVYYFEYNEVVKMKQPVVYYNSEEVEFAKKKPAIFHATTCFYIEKRMWVEKSDHPYSRLYQEYRKKTPWKDEPQIQDMRNRRKKMYAKFWKIIPRKIAIILATYMINYFRPFYAWYTAKARITTIAKQSET
jgi:lipopolysaccharide biosynthesis glycosyltransferase